MRPTWTSTAQFSVLVVLAAYYNEAYGCAWPPLSIIGRQAGGMHPKAAQKVLRELEALGLIRRLGIDQNVPPHTRNQRYAITLFEQPQQRPLPVSPPSDPPSLALVENVVAAAEGGEYRYYPGVVPGLPGGSTGTTGGVVPVLPDLCIDPSSTQERSGTATAASQPGLALGPLNTRPAKDHRRRLAAASPERGHHRVLQRLAWQLLREPRRQRRYLKELIRSEALLVAALKEFAGRKGIEASGDELGAAAASVWVKFTIPGLVKGTAVRPRDRAVARAIRRA